MKISIYFNEKLLILTDKLSWSILELLKQPSTILYQSPKKKLMKELLGNFNSEGIDNIIFYNKKFESLQKKLFSLFNILEAAGGIVQNEKKELLFIFRRGKWDLPKGKIELEESEKLAAAREIEEETSVKELKLKKKICETFHVYTENNLQILKRTHWFYFTTKYSQKLIPQTIEGIDKVKWVATANLKPILRNTYSNIKDVVDIFFDTP